jgi:peptidoglycan/LPS O-acetylase OafA/YrhL
MKYRGEIDGLRALAVLPVICFHAGLKGFAGGYVGVDVFFVISGYLITSIIASEKHAGTFTLARFYERRARRILPALFLVMLACLPFAWLWMLPTDLKELSKSLGAVASFSSNFLFWREGGYFETPGAVKPLFHTWSLAVEEQYYVLFPVFLLAIWGCGVRRIIGIFSTLGVASLALAVWAARNHPEADFYLLPTRGWELLIGAIVALYCFRRPDDIPNTQRPSAIKNEICGALGVALIVVAVAVFDRNVPYPSLYTLVPTLGSALIILCADEHTAVGRALNTPILVRIGLISYSAYLWHQPLFAFARIRLEGNPNGLGMIGLSIAALICAYISWRFVEKPFRNRARINRVTVVVSATGLSVAFLLICYAGVATNGFADRYPKEDRSLAALDFYAAGRYVEGRFVSLEKKPFDASGRLKVFVIGDSFAQDVVNAAYESALTDRLQISTHWIPTRCGNLFLDPSFRSHIDKSRQTICRNSGWYDSASLGLMSSADEIWIASNWTPWEAELLPESVRRLTNDFRVRVRVFGPKNFGRFTIPQLLRMPPTERLRYRNPMNPSYVELNAYMKTSLPAAQFVDVTELLCGRDARCPLFNADGALLTFDGEHLTKDGARYLGSWLSRALSIESSARPPPSTRTVQEQPQD